MIDHRPPRKPRQPGPEMTAGNMRENGVRNLSVRCRECHHEALVSADHIVDDVEIHSIARRLRLFAMAQ
jgi:hypothetical protein